MIRKLALTSLLSAAAALPAAGPLAAQARSYNAGTARAIGQAVVDEEIKEYGRVTNAAWDKDITEILGKLQRAAGYPDLKIDFVVTGNDELNAAAVPGGQMIINAGLMTQFARMTAGQGATPEAQHELFMSYVAAVLSHELAHITLGHTDSLAGQLQALAKAGGAPDSMLRKPSFFAAAAKSDSAELEKLAHTREQELAADRTGSLYLLRAGWSIQTMMDLMRTFDALERDDPSFYQTITYVLDHPRSSYREAALEGFRARLKMLQADYDDALALIQNNVSVPAAITMLDTILVYFPGMVPALHARATAYHQLWLETVPVPTQEVRASLMTYGFRFLPLIRGEPGDMRLYERAKADYLAALQRQPLARTAVQEAMLEAYAGNCDVASKRSHDAALMDSTSLDVINNQGVVLFICDDPGGALAAFKRVEQLEGPINSLPIVFNVGRALKATGSQEATPYLKRYLSADSTSPWAAEARKQLGMAAAPTPAPAPSSARPAPGAASGAPTVQGIALGSSAAQVRNSWGDPTMTKSKGSMTIMDYETRGIDLIVSPSEGVVAIVLNTKAAGSLDGVRVGDPAGAVGARWGTPIESGDDYQLYRRGSWLQAVAIQYGVISGLALLAHE